LSSQSRKCYPFGGEQGRTSTVGLLEILKEGMNSVTPMTLTKGLFRISLGGLITILVLAAAASAQQAVTAENGASAQVRIKNFGQMDARFYRGAQPDKKDYKDLAAMGIKTVIDLRDDPQSYEQPLVESLGMKYVNIPMMGKKYPTAEVTEMFLKTVSDPATGKFFVHCAGGRHRTGAMGAVYRFRFYDWSFDQAYTEMKKYDFYTTWGHQAFKDFVEDYYARTQASKVVNAESLQHTNSIRIQGKP
jgi:tyrosine-protein phosphatase SIW14